MIKKNISIISNITLEPYFELKLKDNFLKSQIEVYLHHISYNQSDFKNNYVTIQNSNYIVVLINIDYMYSNFNNALNDHIQNQKLYADIVKQFNMLYQFLTSTSQATIIWFGFDDYCYYNSVQIHGNIALNDAIIDRINQKIYRTIKVPHIYIDLKKMISRRGWEYSFDNRSKIRWNLPYSKFFVFDLADEIYKHYLIESFDTPKCIVLDCDNVLWGGVLSEEGLDGIRVSNSGAGLLYQDFQRFVQMLYYHGVIIALCSKNDQEDVLRVFREHSGMVLKEDQIACLKVNWNNKAENIKEISNELNIGLDSIVFVDDQIFELELVKKLLPEVKCVQFHRDTIYQNLSCFNLRSEVDINEVKLRNLTYKTNQRRRELEELSSTYEEYLESLKQEVDIHRSLTSELARISELTQRANKCSNGIRYTVDDLKYKIGINEYELYSVYASDKFADLGLVGVVGIENGILDLFVLSCRAIGRNIEEIMLSLILKKAVRSFNFLDTGKNEPLRLFLNNKLINGENNE